MPSIVGQRGVQRRSPGPKHPPILAPLALSGVLPRRAHLRAPSLGGPSASLTIARPGVSGARGSRFLRRRQQLQQLELAARPRLHTHCPQRAPPLPPPPPPAPTVPQRPPRAPRPARSARRRTAAPTDPSAPLFALPGPRISRSHPARGWVCGRPRARAHPPGDYFPSPRAPPPVPTLLFSSAEGHCSAARDAFLCEPRRYWARATAEMRARCRLVRPSLQCVKLGRATAWWWWAARNVCLRGAVRRNEAKGKIV